MAASAKALSRDPNLLVPSRVVTEAEYSSSFTMEPMFPIPIPMSSHDCQVITWQSWEDIGMGIGNIGSIVKLELYSASVTTRDGTNKFGSLDNAFADAAIGGFQSKVRRPRGETDLGAVNNRAEDGLTFPKVDQF